MRKFVMALAMVLTTMCGTAVAESVTGVVERSEDGGKAYYRLYDSGMGFLVGCSDESELTPEVRELLANNVGKKATVNGLVIDHPTWGFCVDGPELLGAAPKADEVASKPSRLTEYDWLKLPDGLSDEEMKIVEMVFVENYWDPAFRAPIHSFIGFCRYFHERGFSVKVKYERVKDKGGSSDKDIHNVTVRMVNVQEDKALEIPLMALHNQNLINEMVKQNGRAAGRARAFVLFPYVLIADSYANDRWLHMDGPGWLNLIRAVVNGGYVREG